MSYFGYCAVIESSIFYKAKLVRTPPPPSNTSVILEETEMMDGVKNDGLVNCNIFFTSISLTFCREYFYHIPECGSCHKSLLHVELPSIRN